MKKHIEVVASVIRYEDRILCVETFEDKREFLSYKFEFPSIEVVAEESHQETLKNKLEFGLKISAEIKDFLMKTTFEYPDHTITIHAYECEAKDPSLTLEAHNRFKWLEIQHLKEIEWAEANMPIVEKILRLFKKSENKPIL